MSIILNGTSFSNGGTATYNGTALDEIRYGNTQVWRRSVTLHNLLSNEATANSQVDIGYNEATLDKGSFTVTRGHRYYVRARQDILNTDWAWTPEARTIFAGTTIASASGSNAMEYGHAILTPSSSTALWQQYLKGQGSTVGGNYWFYSHLYMIVDLTELESALGYQFTASSFWTYIGQTVFYGDKEFTP